MKRECICQSSNPAERAQTEHGLERVAVLHTQSPISQIKMNSLRKYFKKVYKVRLLLNNKYCLCNKMWKIPMQTKLQETRNVQDTQKRISSRRQLDSFFIYTSKGYHHRGSYIRIFFILYSMFYVSIYSSSHLQLFLLH